MFIVELTNKNTGKTSVEFKDTVYEAKRAAIRLTAYAGWLDFIRDREGDLHAENHVYDIDIIAA